MHSVLQVIRLCGARGILLIAMILIAGHSVEELILSISSGSCNRGILAKIFFSLSFLYHSNFLIFLYDKILVQAKDVRIRYDAYLLAGMDGDIDFCRDSRAGCICKSDVSLSSTRRSCKFFDRHRNTDIVIYSLLQRQNRWKTRLEMVKEIMVLIFP